MTFDSYVQQGGALARAFGAGDVVGGILAVFQVVMLALLVLRIAYTFYNLGRQLIGGFGLWASGAYGSPSH